jgi:hypothetical protein
VFAETTHRTVSTSLIPLGVSEFAWSGPQNVVASLAFAGARWEAREMQRSFVFRAGSRCALAFGGLRVCRARFAASRIRPSRAIVISVIVVSLADGQVARAAALDPTSPTAVEVAVGAATPPRQPKDLWDKLQSVSGIVSGVLVAVIGAFATYIYNRRQREAAAADAAATQMAEDARAERELRVQRVQTIQTFFPYLKSDDEREREAALIAVDALGDHELARQLAASYGGPAAFGALSRIAKGHR